MEIPVTAIADSIKRGDILLSEFDGIDHRKQKRTTSVVGRMKDEHINDVVEMRAKYFVPFHRLARVN